MPVTRQTSVEFLNALAKTSPFSSDEKSLLEDFLNRCDLIKFARYEATREDSRLLLEEATRFVKGGHACSLPDLWPPNTPLDFPSASVAALCLLLVIPLLA